jgi:hypothetical protein
MQRRGWLLLSSAVLTLASCRNPDRQATAREVKITPAIRSAGPAGEFGRIGAAALLNDGRFIVVDQQPAEARVFDRRGEHVFSFARSGAGPGEVRRPCCAALGPGDTLWLRDTGNRRYVSFWFDGDKGVAGRVVRMRHTASSLGVAPTFTPAGDLIDVGQQSGGPDAPFTIVRNVLRGDELVSSTSITREPVSSGAAVRRGATTHYFYPAYAPQNVIAHGPDGVWAEARTDKYDIVVHNISGDTITRITRNRTGPRVSALEADSVRRNLDEQARAARVPVGDIRVRVPRRKPPLRDLYFDRVGRLWVHEYTNADHHLARIYDRSGNELFAVRWPVGVNLRRGMIGQNLAIGIQIDSLGMETPVLVRF